MPNEVIALPLGQANTGLPIYGVPYWLCPDNAPLVWNGTAYVPYTSADRNLGAADFGLATEVGATGTYFYQLPAIMDTPGNYFMAWFRRLGGVGVYAITDTEYGISYFRCHDTLADLDSLLFRERNPGAGTSVVFLDAEGNERFTITPAAANGTYAGAVRP